MYERSYGAKYDKNLSTTQIAALVREEIKAAVKAGTLPAGKYSVRSQSYSGGSSIDVRISGLTGQVFEPEYLARGDEYLRGPFVEDATGWHRPSRYALPVLVAVKAVEAMLAAYKPRRLRHPERLLRRQVLRQRGRADGRVGRPRRCRGCQRLLRRSGDGSANRAAQGLPLPAGDRVRSSVEVAVRRLGAGRWLGGAGHGPALHRAPPGP